MSTAELKLSLIERIARTDDALLLRTVHEVLEGPAPSESDDAHPMMVREEPTAYGEAATNPDGLVGEDEVLGVRPDGTPVTAGEAVGGWDKAVQEVLAGGGKPIDEVIAYWKRRANG